MNPLRLPCFFLFFFLVHRSSEYRRWWWANPLGMGLVFYGGYKVWHMTYMVRKQKKSKFCTLVLKSFFIILPSSRFPYYDFRHQRMRKQRRTFVADAVCFAKCEFSAAQIVAAAYGQGGQWLNPVPK